MKRAEKTRKLFRRTLGDRDRALLTGPMSRGCELCFPGLKAVIFITGLCDDACYYCPVSREKLGHDVFYVNEEPVSSIADVIVEIERQGARGASITGGDPLLVPRRSLDLIQALKEAFTSRFHVHLYTSGRYATPGILVSLWKAGLDEIRFHPTNEKLVERIGLAAKLTGMSVGVEIPIAPGLEEWAKRIITKAEKLGAEFVNLNEMEFVAPNAEALMMRGYREDPSRPFTVKGSLEAALRVLEWAAHNAGIPVHFCPALFKDQIQTKNRLLHLSLRDHYWYEKPTGRGTLLWGEVRRPRVKPFIGEACSAESYCVPPDLSLLEKLKDLCSGEAYLVEAYPTRSRRPIITEIPL